MDKKRKIVKEIYEITDIIRKHISRTKASVEDDEVMEIIEKYVFTRQEFAFRDYEETLHIINSIFYNLRKDLSILQPYIEDDDIKEKHLHIGEGSRKGQKDRHIHIIGAEHPGNHPEIVCSIGCHQILLEQEGIPQQQKSSGYGKKGAGKQIDIIPVGSPGALKGCSYGIVKIKGDQCKEVKAGRRHDDPCHQSPYLSMKQDLIRIQIQIL